MKVKLLRDEAAALAEQLAAVSLGPPPTPPTAAAPKEAAVGLVYDKCMELHVGPESAFLKMFHFRGAEIESMALLACLPRGVGASANHRAC